MQIGKKEKPKMETKETKDSANQDTKESAKQSPFTLPSISLPKGGGAIRGIGEKFTTNLATGTGSFNVPIFTSPGRSGFGTNLTLSYDSGSGNGPFGFGWSLSLPAITRKTDKGLPRYEDKRDSDTFLLSGAEDLVPVFRKKPNGNWETDPKTGNRVFDEEVLNGYTIRRYRPRIEGLFARIERWTRNSDLDVHWRSISKDNILTIYGRNEKSRIADPVDEKRVFSWLICESYDDKGNAIIYLYAAENDDAVSFTQVNERNRTRTANRYLKRIKYGNRKPMLIDVNTPSFRKSHVNQPDLEAADWMFEVVFDYNERHYEELPLDPNISESEQHRFAIASALQNCKWSVRPDPFSTYRAGFEVRTYRRCYRVLMFQNFEELADEPYLVRSTEFNYKDLDYSGDIAVDVELQHRGSTRIASVIQSITQSGYVQDDTKSPVVLNDVRYSTYLKKSLPPLEFEYSRAAISEKIKEVDSENLENLPCGIAGAQFQMIDLDGEGISGILIEQAEGWYYKPNLGDGKFGPLEKVASKPSTAVLSLGNAQLLDLAGDGQLDVAFFDGPVKGFYERTRHEKWKNFKPFSSLPNLSWKDPNLKFVDLTGDGHADVMITEQEAINWYPSMAEEGFDRAEKVYQTLNEEKGPRLVFDDGTQSIYLSDMSGDGLIDLVRIRNGEVCYWPNIGYGHFGPKVTMDNSPWFDSQEQFNQKRIRLADVDGSGLTDIIYLGRNDVRIYFNQSGNIWSKAQTIENFLQIDDLSSVQVVDLLGMGTACLVWSSLLSGDSKLPMRYIDLMGGIKPHLLTRSKNNLGAETVIRYTSSTKFYLADKLSDKPWLTKLPFPVYVVEQIETYDHISKNRFITSYTYHHGYFDGIEREFRGFGRVDQKDTEELAILSASGEFASPLNIDTASYVPPVLTKTWFHTGAYLAEKWISRHLESEYYQEFDSSKDKKGMNLEQMNAMLLDDTVLPNSFQIDDNTRVPFEPSFEELREACRALKGSLLRQEIYALDGTDKEKRPYTVSERNYTIEIVQPKGQNKHAIFFTHPREIINLQYERALYKVEELVGVEGISEEEGLMVADPRVNHTITLEVDAYGNPLKSVVIGYGRRYGDFKLNYEHQKRQKQTLITFTENSYTNLVNEQDAYRTPLPSESRTYQLLNFKPDFEVTQTTNLFRFQEMLDKIQSTSDGQHNIKYEDWNVDEMTLNGHFRRLIEHTRTIYRSNNLSSALPLHSLESLALPQTNYKLAFTATLLSKVYQRTIGNGSTESLLPLPSTVLSGTGSDSGGYVDMDGNDNWWIPTGRVYYDINADENNPSTTAEAELVEASQNFFLPRKFTDPFGNSGTVNYDKYDLLAVNVLDAVRNTVNAENDYRVLQPKKLIDANKNQTFVAFDAIGMVVGIAISGKESEPGGKPKGDSVELFEPNVTQSQINQFMAKPRELSANAGETIPTQVAHQILGKATSRIIYDVDRFWRLGKPPVTATILRETHTYELEPGRLSKLQINFSFSDGFGREIQRKIQAEPGPLIEGGIVVGPRWVGSGWVVRNNKGKPVKEYEPFFDDTHNFKFENKVGFGSTLFYDPIERVVAKLHPNHTYEKVVFDPWRQEAWDVNDTVNPLQVFDPNSNLLPDNGFDPREDPDVGEYFKRLPTEEFLPTWYNLRIDASKAAVKWPDIDPVTNLLLPENEAIRSEEKSSAEKTAKHASTPNRDYLDTLGRTFLAVTDNGLGIDGKSIDFKTTIQLDIEGNQRNVIDSKVSLDSGKGRVAILYEYDLLSNRLSQMSMDAGGRWMLNDVRGNPIRTWDGRGHNFWTEYDKLRRPTIHFVRGTNLEHSDPATLDRNVLFKKIEYGEGQANDQDLNLRTRIFLRYDGAGIARNAEYDFKGNLLKVEKEVAKEYKDVINWSDIVQNSKVFSCNATYDALNRRTSFIAPDNSVILSLYNEANLLNSVIVNLRGEKADDNNPIWSTFVANIDYNAKGQRTLITYGNGAETRQRYDPENFRLIGLYTRRGATFINDCGDGSPSGFPAPEKPPPGQSCGLQNIHYTYDPAGNVTSIRDDSQQTIYFNKQVIKPDTGYTYDPTYRLVEAHGREHVGQAQQSEASWNDEFRVRLEHPNDGQKMRNYVESYQYDQVGNLLFFIHKANNSDWIREYKYEEKSLIEGTRKSNRLTETVLHPNAPQPVHEPYSFDAHGNITSMRHLHGMMWNFEDKLSQVDKGTEQIYYSYDASGKRMRKVAEKSGGNLIEDRISLDGFEIFQERDGVGRLNLERETLHVMDDRQRISLVETRTIGLDAAPQKLIRFQFGNHIGSTLLELDEKAQIITYEEYAPYGSTTYQAVRSQTETPKRYRYTCKERDEETGLYCYDARYYAAWLGRWTSCDPSGLQSGPSLYVYACSEPIAHLDKDGRDVEKADLTKKWESNEIAQARALLNKSKLFKDLAKPSTRIVSLSPKEEWETNKTRIEKEVTDEIRQQEAKQGGKPLSKSEREEIRQAQYKGELLYTKFVHESGSHELRLKTLEEFGGSRIRAAKAFKEENKIELYGKGTRDTTETLTHDLSHEYSHLFDPVADADLPLTKFQYSRTEIFAELLGQMILAQAKNEGVFKPSRLEYGGEKLEISKFAQTAINRVYQDDRLTSQQKAERINEVVTRHIVKPMPDPLKLVP